MREIRRCDITTRARLEKKKGGYYYARFYDRNRTPKRKEIPLRTTRKGRARRKLTKLEERFERGEYDPWRGEEEPDNATAREAVEKFLRDKKKSVRTTTYETYRQQLEAWLEGVPPGIMLQDIQTDHIRPYLYQPDISAATKRKRYRHVRAFSNWLEKVGHLDYSLLRDITPPKKEKKTPAFLSPEDLDRLLETIAQHSDSTTDIAGRTPDVQWLVDMVKVAVCTGLRRGELCNLRWQDVDLDTQMLSVRNRDEFKSKSGHERALPIRGDALKVLRRLDSEQEESQEFVFVDRRGLPVKPNRATKRFKFFVREADLSEKDRLHFHSLRHTTGSWLAMRGVPMRVIQAILGHSSISVTEQYSHLQPEVMGQALEKTFE